MFSDPGKVMGGAGSSLINLARVTFFSFATCLQPIIGTTVAAWEWVVPIWLQAVWSHLSWHLNPAAGWGLPVRGLFLTNETTKALVFCLITAFIEKTV